MKHPFDVDDMKFIKLGRFGWSEHVMRMEENDHAKCPLY